jgi:hypothetical protein
MLETEVLVARNSFSWITILSAMPGIEKCLNNFQGLFSMEGICARGGVASAPHTEVPTSDWNDVDHCGCACGACVVESLLWRGHWLMTTRSMQLGIPIGSH